LRSSLTERARHVENDEKKGIDMQNEEPLANKAFRDQIMAAWRDSIPPMMWGMYCGFLQVGFTEEQSLDLTKHVWDKMNQDILKNKKQKPEEIQ